MIKIYKNREKTNFTAKEKTWNFFTRNCTEIFRKRNLGIYVNLPLIF